MIAVMHLNFGTDLIGYIVSHISTVIPRLTKIIHSGITLISRNLC